MYYVKSQNKDKDHKNNDKDCMYYVKSKNTDNDYKNNDNGNGKVFSRIPTTTCTRPSSSRKNKMGELQKAS